MRLHPIGAKTRTLLSNTSVSTLINIYSMRLHPIGRKTRIPHINGTLFLTICFHASTSHWRIPYAPPTQLFNNLCRATTSHWPKRHSWLDAIPISLLRENLLIFCFSRTLKNPNPWTSRRTSCCTSSYHQYNPPPNVVCQRQKLRCDFFPSNGLHRLCVQFVLKIAQKKFTKILKNLVLAVAYSLQRKWHTECVLYIYSQLHWKNIQLPAT